MLNKVSRGRPHAQQTAQPQTISLGASVAEPLLTIAYERATLRRRCALLSEMQYAQSALLSEALRTMQQIMLADDVETRRATYERFLGMHEQTHDALDDLHLRLATLCVPTGERAAHDA